MADDSLTDDDIDDVVRSVSLPIGSFLNVTDTEPINFDSVSDNDPDYALVNSHATLAYDDGGGALTDSDEVGASFVVPEDYASGGAFRFTVTQSATTAANLEQISCEVSGSGGATSAPATRPLFNAASQRATVTPNATYFTGISVSVNGSQSNPSRTTASGSTGSTSSTRASSDRATVLRRS